MHFLINFFILVVSFNSFCFTQQKDSTSFALKNSLTEEEIQLKIDQIMPTFLQLSSDRQELLLNALLFAAQVAWLEEEINTTFGLVTEALYDLYQEDEANINSKRVDKKFLTLTAYLEKIKKDNFVVRRQLAGVIDYLRREEYKQVADLFQIIQATVQHYVTIQLVRSASLIDLRIKEFADSCDSAGNSLVTYAALLNPLQFADFQGEFNQNNPVDSAVIHKTETVSNVASAVVKTVAKKLLPSLALLRNQYKFVGIFISTALSMYYNALYKNSDLGQQNKLVRLCFTQEGWYTENQTQFVGPINNLP